jgi:hypothetical protein
VNAVRQSFLGNWDVYSGPMALELVLHDDGSYGVSAFGGAQTHWGVWELEAQQDGSTLLALQPQGATPPGLLAVYGGAQAVERHVVMSVQPNQIQFYDALMVRRYVPPQNPGLQFAHYAAGAPMTPPIPQVNPIQQPVQAQLSQPQQGFFQTPIAAPSPAYSAPPPAPMPAAQSTPILNQWKNFDPDTAKKISDIYVQMYAQDRATTTAINAASAAAYTADFTANETAMLNQSQASHDFAKKFSDTLNPPRR